MRPDTSLVAGVLVVRVNPEPCPPTIARTEIEPRVLIPAPALVEIRARNEDDDGHQEGPHDGACRRR